MPTLPGKEFLAPVKDVFFKEVTSNKSGKKLLLLGIAVEHEAKTYKQEIFFPTSSASEKAVEFFEKNIKTIGLGQLIDEPKPVDDKYSRYTAILATILSGNVQSTMGAEKAKMDYKIITEIDDKGYEKIKYIDDPNAMGAVNKLSDEMKKLLGMDQGEADADRIPF